METSADELKSKDSAAEECIWFAKDYGYDTNVSSTKEKHKQTDKLGLILIKIKNVCAAEDTIQSVKSHAMGETDDWC